MKKSFKKVVRKAAQLGLVASLFLGLSSCSKLNETKLDKYEQAQVELDTNLQEANLENYLNEEISKENRVAFNNALNSLHEKAENLYSEELITKEKLDAFKLYLDNVENRFITYNIEKSLNNFFNLNMISYNETFEGSSSDTEIIFNGSELFERDTNTFIRINNEGYESYSCYTSLTGSHFIDSHTKKDLIARTYLDEKYDFLYRRITEYSLPLNEASSIYYDENTDTYTIIGNHSDFPSDFQQIDTSVTPYNKYTFNGDLFYQFIDSTTCHDSMIGSLYIISLRELDEIHYLAKSAIFQYDFEKYKNAYENQDDQDNESDFWQ